MPACKPVIYLKNINCPKRSPRIKRHALLIDRRTVAATARTPLCTPWDHRPWPVSLIAWSADVILMALTLALVNLFLLLALRRRPKSPCRG